MGKVTRGTGGATPREPTAPGEIIVGFKGCLPWKNYVFDLLDADEFRVHLLRIKISYETFVNRVHCVFALSGRNKNTNTSRVYLKFNMVYCT